MGVPLATFIPSEFFKQSSMMYAYLIVITFFSINFKVAYSISSSQLTFYLYSGLRVTTILRRGSVFLAAPSMNTTLTSVSESSYSQSMQQALEKLVQLYNVHVLAYSLYCIAGNFGRLHVSKIWWLVIYLCNHQIKICQYFILAYNVLCMASSSLNCQI